MTFALIIPTYNEEGVVEHFLADIVKQSRRPDEIIIADAHSTDRTREIAKEYGAVVVDGGLPGPGRNRGAEYASSDILVFMDADVRLFDPDFFDKLIGEFESRKLGAAAVQLKPMSERWDDALAHAVYNWLLFRQAHAKKPLAAGSCMLAQREVHETIQGFDEDVTLGEDTDYAMRAARVAPFEIMTSVKVPASVRRLDRDGRWTTLRKYLAAGIHVALKGPVKKHKIKYEFGYDHMKKKK